MTDTQYVIEVDYEMGSARSKIANIANREEIASSYCYAR
jgi:hypothetical protein